MSRRVLLTYSPVVLLSPAMTATEKVASADARLQVIKAIEVMSVLVVKWLLKCIRVVLDNN